MEILEPDGPRHDFRDNYGQPADRSGCLAAIVLSLGLWGVIIWTGIYLWRNL